ncbi:PAS domain S-box protein [Puia sp. P3]|uniref:PAS domain-containing sensor histidine kinase n=1 Tax=Puia sp. P3 TaxID=3423952 RepID=UPI003D679601
MKRFETSNNNNPAKMLQAYQTAIDHAAIVSITDLAGKILYVNDRFVKVSQYKRSDLLGNTHRIVNSEYHSPEFFQTMWATITAGKPWRGEIRNRAKDGSFYWVDTVITPVFDEDRNIVQFLSIRNLITVQKSAEAQLRKSQIDLMKRDQQMNEAQRVAMTGSWFLDIPANSLEWTEEAYRIFDIPFGRPMTYESFLERVHPDDREFVNRSWADALTGAKYDIEHRIFTSSGEKWVRENAILDRGPSHSFVSAVGTVQDISERKKTENILKDSESRYKSLFNSSPFPISIIDKKTLKFLEVNEAAIRLYGYSREEFMNLTIYDFRLPGEKDMVKQQLDSNNYESDKRIRYHRKKNGDLIQVEPSIVPIDYKGRDALLITLNDVTEKIQMQEALTQERVSRQKEISQATMEAQEKDRAEIGSELHDNVNQLLAASNLYLKHIEPESKESRQLLNKSISIINQAIEEVRRLSWSLVPPRLNDLSLKENIVQIVPNMAFNHTKVQFNIDIAERLLSEGLKINIYRIIQEQFHNIIKYAHAETIKISLTQVDNRVMLDICDDGQGFDLTQKSKGIGLSNIIRRSETYNGKVQIDSSIGKGCRVTIEFAIDPIK